ncbi:MAG: extracellular solute-binding protein, partial [Chloroflexota bacterium]|nr:extracellular solute-binding protein [Chloroflexota bacterium]
ARPLFWSKTALKKLGWSDADIAALPDKNKSGQFTLQDVLDTAKAEQDKGVVPKGNGFWTRWGQGNDWYEFYYSFGGQLQDPATGKLVMVKDAWQKYYEFFYNAFNTSGVSRKDCIGADTSKVVYPGVTSGNVGFYFGGTWQWAEWAKIYVADKGGEKYLNETLGYGLIPASTKGGKPTTVTHPLVYMVSSQSKYQEIAFRLITLASADDLNTLHAVGSGHLAINKTQASYPAYAEAKFLQSATYMLDYTNFIPNHAKFSIYDNVTWKALTAVASGEMKPDQAVKLVEDELKAQMGADIMFK